MQALFRYLSLLLAAFTCICFAQSTTTTLQSTTSTASTASSSSSSSSPSPSSTLAIYPGDGSFQYVGCYNETTLVNGSSGARALTGSQESIDNLTPEKCLSFCGSSNFAGLEYGRECWCGSYINSLAKKVEDSQCNLPCSGNSSAVCGGNLRLTMYSNGKANYGAGGSTGAGSQNIIDGCCAGLVLVGVLFAAFL